MATAAARRAISPYARRLARERGVAIDEVSGSGPAGRIVAADIVAFVPRATPAAAPTAASAWQASALGTTISLTNLREVLEAFGQADMAFTLDDAILRAAGCALSDVAGANRLAGAPVALEHERRQLVFADISKGSLGPARVRRLAAIEAGSDQSTEPAAVSLKLIAAADIRPLMLPLLPGRAMRLVLSSGPTAGECLLAFDEAQVEIDAAAEFLARFKAYLEVPLRLLA
jgi:pyruvate dehydrogenase E2 component (dihydrolipoamide acetyltransferase)